MDEKVLNYFEKQPRIKRNICYELRSIILQTLPNINEEYRWGAVVYGNGRFYIGSVRRGVNLGVAITGLSREEVSIFRGTGKTMRHLKFESLSDINKNQIATLLKLVNKKVTLPAM